MSITDRMFFVGIGMVLGFFGSLALYISWPVAVVLGFSFMVVGWGFNRITSICIGIFIGGLPMWWVATEATASSSMGIDWTAFWHLIPQSFITAFLFFVGAVVGIGWLRFKKHFL